MREFRERDLQTYVEANFAARLHKWLTWLDPYTPVQMLGAQVPCANGVIDLLGAIRFTPVVVELKAELATEKVTGQVMRYKAAVDRIFLDWCCASVLRCELGRETELAPMPTMCIVIAPDFDARVAASINEWGFLLQARQIAAGAFDITPFATPRNVKAYPQLTSELSRLARCYVGQRLGAAMNNQLRQLIPEQLPFDERPGPEAEL